MKQICVKKSIQGKTEIPPHFSCIRRKSNISDEDNVSLSFWRGKHVRWLEIVSSFVICLFSSVPCLTFENTTCFVSFFLVQQQKCIRPSSMGTIWCHFWKKLLWHSLNVWHLSNIPTPTRTQQHIVWRKILRSEKCCLFVFSGSESATLFLTRRY